MKMELTEQFGLHNNQFYENNSGINNKDNLGITSGLINNDRSENINSINDNDNTENTTSGHINDNDNIENASSINVNDNTESTSSMPINDTDNTKTTSSISNNDHAKNTSVLNNNDHAENTSVLNNNEHAKNTSVLNNNDHAKNTSVLNNNDHANNTSVHNNNEHTENTSVHNNNEHAKNTSVLNNNDNTKNTSVLNNNGNAENTIGIYDTKVAEKGRRPLHSAALNGDSKRVCHLLRHGADVNSKDDEGNTPLHYAMISMKSSIIKSLIQRGAIVDTPDDDGNTPLLEASYMCSDSPQPVGLLLKHGADVNHKNRRGWSALLRAAYMVNPRCTRVLLKAGADTTIISTVDGRPFSLLSLLLNKWYTQAYIEEMSLRLLKRGAPTKYVRNDVIHRLAAAGSNTLVKKLIQHGLYPTDIALNENLFEWPLLTISPMTVCLMLRRCGLVTFFYDHWFLTPTDVKVLSRNMDIINYLNFRDKEVGSDVSQLVLKISAQPLRLVLLSFIAVSTAVGTGADREERVESAGIPRDLRDRLMYRNLLMTRIKETNESDASYYLHELARLQVFEAEPGDRYFRRDENFYIYGEDSHVTGDSDGGDEMGVEVDSDDHYQEEVDSNDHCQEEVDSNDHYQEEVDSDDHYYEEVTATTII